MSFNANNVLGFNSLMENVVADFDESFSNLVSDVDFEPNVEKESLECHDIMCVEEPTIVKNISTKVISHKEDNVKKKKELLERERKAL